MCTLLCLKNAERMNEKLYVSLPLILDYVTLEAISLRFALRIALFLRNQSLKCESEGYSSHHSISDMIIPSQTFQSFGTYKKTIKISTELL